MRSSRATGGWWAAAGLETAPGPANVRSSSASARSTSGGPSTVPRECTTRAAFASVAEGAKVAGAKNTAFGRCAGPAARVRWVRRSEEADVGRGMFPMGTGAQYTRLLGRVRLTGLWQHPDFLKLWAGQSVSLVGSSVTGLALPLTAVLLLNATPAQMGIMRAAQYLP